MKPSIYLVPILSTLLAHGAAADTSAKSATEDPPDLGGQIISGYQGDRVGIGTATPATTLDIYQGEVKIGSTGAACTADLAGALRATNNKLQFCDGAGWRNVSLDKAE